MSASILAVAVAGELPPGHRHAELAKRAVDPATLDRLVLPPTLARERKVRVLVEAAHRALAGLVKERPEALARCALVVVTRFDARPANLIDQETEKIVPFADMPPTTLAFSFVSHMAASCIPHVLKLRGPAVSIAAREGLAAGMRIGERWIGRIADHALVIESDLAMPSYLPAELPVPNDYALAVLLGNGESHV